jgi:hypothetical protein
MSYLPAKPYNVSVIVKFNDDYSTGLYIVWRGVRIRIIRRPSLDNGLLNTIAEQRSVNNA